MGKWTTGPWIWRAQSAKSWDLVAANGVCIIRATGVAGADADGDLIAAAPELLEACQSLIAFCDKNPPAGESLWCVQIARAAIAKATGGQP